MLNCVYMCCSDGDDIGHVKRISLTAEGGRFIMGQTNGYSYGGLDMEGSCEDGDEDGFFCDGQLDGGITTAEYSG